MTIFKFKKEVFFLAALVLLYFASRLINLGAVPIFTDEAIYLHWSQAIASDLKFLYLPLSDGKPPLFMWATAGVMAGFPNIDPLYAGRLVSVFSGFVAMLGIFFTSFQFFKSKRISYLSSLLYIVTPFTFFYDRFGLSDSMLTMLAIWALGLGVVLAKTLSLRVAVILGVVIGLEWLTKTPALFSLVFLIPLVIFVKNGRGRVFALLIVTFVISRLIYSLLFLFPQAYVISLKSQEFLVGVAEFLRNPFSLLFGNAKSLINWEVSYLTLPLIAPLVLGIAAKFRDFWKEKLILAGYFAAYFIFLALFNKVIYPRYLLLFTPGLLILVAVGMDKIIQRFEKKLIVVLLLLSVVLFLPLYTDYQLTTNPAYAPIADNDSEQYLNSWPAGWGVREINNFFRQQCKDNNKINIGTEGTFGLMPYSLELYQKDHPCLVVYSYWPPPGTLPEGLDYYLIYQREKTPDYDGKMELVSSYQQGKSQHFLKLYRIVPKS